MRDISAKIKTLRTAKAKASLSVSPQTLRMIEAQEIPKGDPFPVAKVAAIQAAKQTSQIVPYCHPISLDAVTVDFEVGTQAIDIRVTVKTVAKTGVEMEALTAASVAALTLYDMLKMLDETMAITSVSLLEKTGGKSSFHSSTQKALRGAVLVLSDSISANKKQDVSGPLILERFKQYGIEVVDYSVIPDNLHQIETMLKNYADNLQIDLVLTSGGTGLSPRDQTPEAMTIVIERDIPGISEMLRQYGQERTPYAVLSRGQAGIRGKTLLINLPGSANGVNESLDALFPAILHSFPILKGEGHAYQHLSQPVPV